MKKLIAMVLMVVVMLSGITPVSAEFAIDLKNIHECTVTEGKYHFDTTRDAIFYTYKEGFKIVVPKDPVAGNLTKRALEQAIFAMDPAFRKLGKTYVIADYLYEYDQYNATKYNYSNFQAAATYDYVTSVITFYPIETGCEWILYQHVSETEKADWMDSAMAYYTADLLTHELGHGLDRALGFVTKSRDDWKEVMKAEERKPPVTLENNAGYINFMKNPAEDFAMTVAEYLSFGDAAPYKARTELLKKYIEEYKNK